MGGRERLLFLGPRVGVGHQSRSLGGFSEAGVVGCGGQPVQSGCDPTRTHPLATETSSGIQDR